MKLTNQNRRYHICLSCGAVDRPSSSYGPDSHPALRRVRQHRTLLAEGQTFCFDLLIAAVQPSTVAHSFVPPQSKAHQFVVKTFNTPTKCNRCTSLMVGLIRQGCTCEGKDGSSRFSFLLTVPSQASHLSASRLQYVTSPAMSRVRTRLRLCVPYPRTRPRARWVSTLRGASARCTKGTSG